MPCSPGFTYQYHQLNALIELQPETVSILAVPCNQFGHQEPAANETELLAGLKYVRPGSGFVPSFSLTGRSDVNGKDELPLYAFLKSKCPLPTHASFDKKETFWNPIHPSDVTWNFEKFVVNSSGHPIFRFLPDVEPFDIIDIITDYTNTG